MEQSATGSDVINHHHNIHHYQALNLNSKLIYFHCLFQICKVTEALLHYTLKILM